MPRKPRPWNQPMFAYGVNTNIPHLRMRCPDWEGQWCSAWLPDYRMRFEKAYPGASTSYCNVQESEGSIVYGVLLWLDEDSFKAIDRYEGHPIHYDRKLVTVQTKRAGEFRAWTYFSDHVDPSLPPSQVYFRNVMQGLISSGAPQRYLNQVIADARSKDFQHL